MASLSVVREKAFEAANITALDQINKGISAAYIFDGRPLIRFAVNSNFQNGNGANRSCNSNYADANDEGSVCQITTQRTLDDITLANEGTVGVSNVRDAWGNRFYFDANQCDGNRDAADVADVDSIRSPGPDSLYGTSDDISFTGALDNIEITSCS